MATMLYKATWVSDEIAGDTSHPNILQYWAPDDIHGLAVATAIDPHVSGDNTSITVQISGSNDRTTYPVAGGGVDAFMMGDAAEIFEHCHFTGVHFDVKAALQGYVLANPGNLKTFKLGTNVVAFKGAGR